MYTWEEYFKEYEASQKKNAELIKAKFRECEAYTEKELKRKYPDCGIVYTRHEETIKAGYFMIWIDNGSISHKRIWLCDCGIQPLAPYSYPEKPTEKGKGKNGKNLLKGQDH